MGFRFLMFGVTPVFLVEIVGIEPATCSLRTNRSTNWAISPIMVGTAELESATSCMSSKRSNQLSYAPINSLKI